jgi:hypothetical protein
MPSLLSAVLLFPSYTAPRNTQQGREERERETTRQGIVRQGRGGEKERRGCGTHFFNFEKKIGLLLKVALIHTTMLRFSWTDSVQISKNYTTIVKIHNFARQMLQPKEY